MKNIKIGMRLGIGFGAVIFMMIVIAVIGITRLQAGSGSIDEIVNTTYAKVVLITEIRAGSDVGARNLRNAMLATTPEDTTKFLNAMSESAKGTREAFGKLDKLVNLPKERELIKEISDAMARYVTVRTEVIKLLREGRKDEATVYLFEQVIPVYSVYNAAIDKSVDFQRHSMDEEGQAALSQAGSATLTMIVLSVLAAALAIFLGLIITRSITRPLNQAVKVAETVASGDLSSRIHVSSKDETGQLLQALKHMNENLVTIVGDVRASTDTIATASSEIAAGNLDLSSRTEQQASSLEETASSMEELTSTVKQNADNARQANCLALAASEVAVKGGAVVSQVVDTMGSINHSSKKIVDIIGVIDGIAFQTNILALNAAVEAARAGEQGRGFAVVAAEVRTLAQRSAAAAKEIKSLIDDSVNKVSTGARLVDQAGATMQEIVDSVRRVTDIMSEIAAASQEQTSGIEQINQAIGQMDQVTQQNASLVEEAAAAAESMQDQAGRLAQAVSVFKLDNSHVAAAAPVRAVVTKQNVLAKRAMVAPQRKQIAHAAEGEWEEFSR
jgi:methyl-accepting chemotaxis protein